MEIQEQFGLLATLFEVGDLLKELCGLGEIALQRIRARADNERSGVIGLKLQGLVGKLFAFRLVTAGERALGSGNVGLDGIASLAHGLVQIGQANLNAEIVRFGLQELFQQADGLGLAILLQMDFG